MVINDNPQIPEADKVLLCQTCMVQQKFVEKHVHLEDGTPAQELYCVECNNLITRMILKDNKWQLDTSVYGRKNV